jgi:hypothetical protein
MDISPRMQKTINGRLVEVGAQWNQPLAWPHLQVVTTCDGTSPETYHAEVRMGGHVLVRTEPTDDLHRAERAAENAFTAKIAALFED